MYSDKTIVCKDCGQEFTFTANEQEFFAEKGFTNEPQRCKPCRDARKGASNNRQGGERRFQHPARGLIRYQQSTLRPDEHEHLKFVMLKPF